MLAFLGLDGWSSAIIALVLGTAAGSVIGLLPGIGARIGIILFLPFAATFDPYAAAIFMFALQSVTNTSSSIPNIALGLPTSSSDAATILDGYPLAKMGRGGEALGASLSASAIGGVLSAFAFLAAIPVAIPLVTSFGPPEVLMLALIGITMVAALSREGLFQGLAVAALGIGLSMVGLDGRTGVQRFTFGSLDLWDGLALPAIICGLFVIPEMLTVKRHTDHGAFRQAISTRLSDVFRGMFITFRHTGVLIRSTLTGILVGLTPALGSSVAVWMAYAHAARTTKTDIPFGEGAIAGVIAPEAANNSKEGGAMIPTLFLAVPGSSSMAIMMAALAFVGVAVGPNMLTTDLGLSFALAATVVLANIIAIPFFFMVVPGIVRMSALRREMIAPVAIALSVMAALVNEPTLTTAFQVIAAGVLGVALKYANWPRAPFILGFVIAELAEKSFFLTHDIYGWSAFTRPLTVILLIALLASMAFALLRRPPLRISGPRSANLSVSAALMGLFGFMLVMSIPLPLATGLVPRATAVLGLGLCLLVFVAAVREKPTGESDEAIRFIGLTGLFVGSTPIIGLLPATFIYVTTVLRRTHVGLWRALAAAFLCCAFQLILLVAVFDVLIEREIIGRLGWFVLGY